MVTKSFHTKTSRLDRAKSYFRLKRKSRPVAIAYTKGKGRSFGIFLRQSNCEGPWVSVGSYRSQSNLSSFNRETSNLDLQKVLCRKGTFVTAIIKGMKKGLKHSTPNTGNVQRLGIILLFLFVINAATSIFLYYNRGKQIECIVDLSGLQTDSGHTSIYELTNKDCKIDDAAGSIYGDKIFVYYQITDYPFHASSVYKLHSKHQLKGKVVTDASEIPACHPFSVIVLDDVNRVLHPCGSHLWNIYNDSFKFSEMHPTSGTVFLPLDESEGLLKLHQEYSSSKNPTPKEMKETSDRVFYWLFPDQDVPVRDGPIAPKLRNRSIPLTQKTYRSVLKVHEMMNSKVAGEGVQNGHFIQWMTPPPFKSFRKLYGALKGPIKLPLYITVDSVYDVASFGGKKSLILVSPAWPYGKIAHIQGISASLAVVTLLLGCFLLFNKNRTSCVNII